MILWIASYPKSGNTWVRLFLRSYFCKAEKQFSINQKEADEFKINQFPNINILKEMNINYNNFLSISENWISMQERINLNNKVNFLKTHNAMCTINNHKFTNKQNTAGIIYIVRDPRDIVISYSHHLNQTYDQVIDGMLDSKNQELAQVKKEKFPSTILGKWSDHYNSWKNYGSENFLLIKYEDMLFDDIKIFRKILEYLNNTTGLLFDQSKMLKAIENTSFEKLQNQEKKFGFNEHTKSTLFFRNGKIGDWKGKLSLKQVKRIEEGFNKEMKELGYL